MRNGFLTACPVLVFCLCLPACTNTDVHVEKPGKPQEISHIRFFLETSASMEGYMKGNTQFSNLVPDLLVELENKVDFRDKPIDISYIADSVQHYNGSTRSFIHDISVLDVAKSKGSEMHKIFQYVADHTDSNDISILVSDCILSYPDKDIRTNPEINVQKAGGELKTSIIDEFLKMKKKNIVTSVYGFHSAFNGKYYDYRNAPTILTAKSNIDRPFYFWIIGKKELIRKFDSQLHSIKSFTPDLSIEFGIFDRPIKQYTILFKTERSGNWSTDYQHITDLDVTKATPCRFALAVDLSSLPDYARSVDYLRDNLKINQDGLTCKLLEIRNAGDIDKTKAAPKERALLAASTHVLILQVTEIYKSETNIHVQLPLIYDQKYLQWSIMDDRDCRSSSGRTFAFQHLVEGVKEAYQNDNQEFVDLEINLKK